MRYGVVGVVSVPLVYNVTLHGWTLRILTLVFNFCVMLMIPAWFALRGELLIVLLFVRLAAVVNFITIIMNFYW